MSQWPTVPLSDTLRNVRTALRTPPLWFDKLINKYGDTFILIFPNGQRILFTAESELVRHVFQTGHKYFGKTEVQTGILADVLGNGLLTSEGDYWLRQRRLIQPGFHRQRLAALVEIMHAEIDKGIEELRLVADSGKVIDLSDYMMRLTFRIVSASLFTAAVSDEELRTIEETIDEGNQHVINVLRKPWMRPWYHLTGRYKKVYAMRDEVNKILNRVILNRRNSGEAQQDLLQMLLDVRYEDTGEGMTAKQLQDETIVLYAAGHETSANGLSWLFWFVQDNAEIEKALLKEIADTATEQPGFAELPTLSYTACAVNEGLRMRPPAWAVDRICLESHEFQGNQIEKGQRVLMYIMGLHKNDRYWKNADQFEPERFAKSNYERAQKQAFIPFGAGPRQCIGNSFAQMEMQLVLYRLFKHFRFEYAAKQAPTLQPLITLQPREGMPMRIYSRN